MKTDDDKLTQATESADQGRPKELKRRHHERDRLGGLVLGIIIILLGVLLIFDQQGYLEDGVWGYFIFGVGLIFLIEVLVRAFVPQYYRPLGGKIFWAIVFMLIGASNLYDLDIWWPAILIIAGAALIAASFRNQAFKRQD